MIKLGEKESEKLLRMEENFTKGSWTGRGDDSLAKLSDEAGGNW